MKVGLTKDEQEVYDWWANDWSKKYDNFDYRVLMIKLKKSRSHIENALYGLRKKGILKSVGVFGTLFKIEVQ